MITFNFENLQKLRSIVIGPSYSPSKETQAIESWIKQYKNWNLYFKALDGLNKTFARESRDTYFKMKLEKALNDAI